MEFIEYTNQKLEYPPDLKLLEFNVRNYCVIYGRMKRQVERHLSKGEKVFVIPSRIEEGDFIEHVTYDIASKFRLHLSIYSHLVSDKESPYTYGHEMEVPDE